MGEPRQEPGRVADRGDQTTGIVPVERPGQQDLAALGLARHLLLLDAATTPDPPADEPVAARGRDHAVQVVVGEFRHVARRIGGGQHPAAQIDRGRGGKRVPVELDPRGPPGGLLIIHEFHHVPGHRVGHRVGQPVGVPLVGQRAAQRVGRGVQVAVLVVGERGQDLRLLVQRAGDLRQVEAVGSVFQSDDVVGSRVA